MRGLARACLTLVAVLTFAATAVALSRHPFAAPIAERSAAELQLALDAAMARALTAEEVLARLDAAVEAADRDRIALYLDLAAEQGLAVGPEAAAMLAALEDAGPLAAGAACARCAYDIAECRSLTQIGACALPVELTPLGDLNALRREAVRWQAGGEVDEVTVALAGAGLAASSAILVTAGGSAGVKAGATMLRVARQTGSLAPRLAAELRATARGAVRWEALPAYAAGRAGADAAFDLPRLARLGEVAGDAQRLAANTSPAMALDLMRHADTSADVARLARLSDVAGPRTLRAVEVLGPARALRLVTRVADLVLLTLGLLSLVLAQIGSALLWLLRRALRRRPARCQPRPARP